MERPSKVLIVNWQDRSNPLSGGAEVHLHEVGKRMVQRGIECILYVSRYPGCLDYERADGMDVYRRGSRWNFNFIVFFSIHRWLQQHNPDVIIDDSNKIPFFLPWLTRRPVLVRTHHLFRSSIYREASLPAATYVYLMETLGALSWRNTKVVTVSESTRQELNNLGVRHVQVALNGVDHNRFYSRTTDKKSRNSLLYLGRLKRYKSIETILAAIEILRKKQPGIKLEVVGAGDDLQRLESIVKSKGLDDCIRFIGYVAPEKLREHYAEAGLMLNSSLKEGYGLTTIEANACGTCVVATDVAGLRDSIRRDVTGLLVPFKSAGKMAEAIGRLLEDPKKLKEMEKAALAFAREHTWERTSEVTISALKEVMEGRAP